jgi:hypothetical protein
LPAILTPESTPTSDVGDTDDLSNTKQKSAWKGRICTKQSLFGAITVTITKRKFVEDVCIPIFLAESDKELEVVQQGINWHQSAIGLFCHNLNVATHDASFAERGC